MVIGGYQKDYATESLTGRSYRLRPITMELKKLPAERWRTVFRTKKFALRKV